MIAAEIRGVEGVVQRLQALPQRTETVLEGSIGQLALELAKRLGPGRTLPVRTERSGAGVTGIVGYSANNPGLPGGSALPEPVSAKLGKLAGTTRPAPPDLAPAQPPQDSFLSGVLADLQPQAVRDIGAALNRSIQEVMA